MSLAYVFKRILFEYYDLDGILSAQTKCKTYMPYSDFPRYRPELFGTNLSVYFCEYLSSLKEGILFNQISANFSGIAKK